MNEDQKLTNIYKKERNRIILLANFFNLNKNEKRTDEMIQRIIIIQINSENRRKQWKNLITLLRQWKTLSLDSMKSIASIKLHYPLFKRRIAVDTKPLENMSSYKMKVKRKTSWM